MFAAQCGHAACVKLLILESGLADAEDSTALVMAVHRNHLACCKLLFKEPRRSDNWSALLEAVF